MARSPSSARSILRKITTRSSVRRDFRVSYGLRGSLVGQQQLDDKLLPLFLPSDRSDEPHSGALSQSLQCHRGWNGGARELELQEQRWTQHRWHRAHSSVGLHPFILTKSRGFASGRIINDDEATRHDLTPPTPAGKTATAPVIPLSASHNRLFHF